MHGKGWGSKIRYLKDEKMRKARTKKWQPQSGLVRRDVRRVDKSEQNYVER